MHVELTKMKKWMLAGLCATVMLCCADIQTVFAQDYEAVGKRLRKAVAAGELTGEQARAMLGTLRKASQSDKKAGGRDATMEGLVKRVRIAIEAGDITPQQGRARLQGMKKRMAEGTRETGARRAEHGEEGRDSRAVYAAAEKEIKAAIEAGRITKAQGKERLVALRRHLAAGGGETRARRGERGAEARDLRARYAAAEKKIKAAMQAGRITEAQGKERLAGLRRRVSVGARDTGDHGEEGRDLRARYAAAEKEIKAAIAAGKVTPEQGRTRLRAMREHLAVGTTKAKKRDPKPRDPKAVYAAAAKKIQAAIDSGREAEAQGKERLVALRKHLAEGARGQRTRGENVRRERTRQRDPKAVYQAAEKGIKAAIAEGKITEEQGRERLAGLRRRLAEGARETEAHHSEHGEEGEHETRGERTRRR